MRLFTHSLQDRLTFKLDIYAMSAYVQLGTPAARNYLHYALAIGSGSSQPPLVCLTDGVGFSPMGSSLKASRLLRRT